MRADGEAGEAGDDGVVAAACAGEEWALVSLYRWLHPALARYLRAHAPGEEEDLATEVWLDVARALPGFVGGEDGLRRLAFTIARRRAIDHRRKRDRRRTVPVADPALDCPPEWIDPEAEIVGRLSADAAVAEVIRILPAEQADIVLLRVVAGLSVAEVAEITGRRPVAVSVIQHRALRRLATHLGRRPAALGWLADRGSGQEGD